MDYVIWDLLNWGGISFLAVAVTLGIVFNRTVLGIPNILFECIGLALLAFAWGLSGNILSFVIVLAGFVIAMFADPFVWRRLGQVPDGDKSVRKLSVYLNGSILAVAALFYALGRLAAS